MQWRSHLLAPFLLFGAANCSPFQKSTSIVPSFEEPVSDAQLKAAIEDTAQCNAMSASSSTEMHQAAKLLQQAIVDTSMDPMLPGGNCVYRTVGDNFAQICNTDTLPQNLTAHNHKTIEAFDYLLEACSSNKVSASFQVPETGLEYSIFPKSLGLHYGNRNNRLAKRVCVEQSDRNLYGTSRPICNPSRKIDKDGNCPFVEPDGDKLRDDSSCWSYCEVRSGNFYGPPGKIDDIFCGVSTYHPLESSFIPILMIVIPNERLEIELTQRIYIELRTLGSGIHRIEYQEWTVTKKFSFELSNELTAAKDLFENIFKASTGFSVEFSESKGSGSINDFPEDKCGYWTWVPLYVEVCGTLTEYQAIPPPQPLVVGTHGKVSVQSMKPYCTKNSKVVKSYPNICTVSERRNRDGKVDSTPAARLHDCGSRIELPMDQQMDQWRAYYDRGLDRLKPETEY